MQDLTPFGLLDPIWAVAMQDLTPFGLDPIWAEFHERVSGSQVFDRVEDGGMSALLGPRQPVALMRGIGEGLEDWVFTESSG